MNTQQDSTMFKTFANYSELIKKTANHSVFVKLHGCGWFIPVTKKAIKKVADSMSKHEEKFCGKISFMGGGKKSVQVELY